MVNYRMTLGVAAIAALVSGPAFAVDLITNGSFETNGGIGQLAAVNTTMRHRGRSYGGSQKRHWD